MQHKYFKYIAGFTLATLALIISCGLVLAQTNGPSGAVAMTGQATAVGTEQSPELRIRINAAGQPGWLLETALDPVLLYRGNYGDDGATNLNGSFTLGTPQLPIASGTATGWIDQTGSGDVKLTSTKGPSQLDMSFNVASDASVSAQVQGQWPALPVVQAPSVPQTTSSLPAQPTNHFFWYLSRTSGMLAFILLFVSLCFGLGLRSRFFDRVVPKWLVYDFHRVLALMAMALMALHIFSLLGDSYFNLTVSQLLLPFDSPYRPIWSALGVIAFYLVLVGAVSMYLRRFMTKKTWRLVHGAAFVLFFAVLLHGIESGTDSVAIWAQLMYISTGVTVVFLFLRRYGEAALDLIA